MNTSFARPRGWLALAAALSLGACAALQPPPDAQSIAHLSPAGVVSLTETVVAGYTAGSGRLDFQGHSYPFRLLGGIVGPGGAARIEAAGEVYKLASVADFTGRYTQGTGPAGLDTANTSDLWLQNKAGVIMHLRGVSEGVVLSLGRDEILIEFTN